MNEKQAINFVEDWLINRRIKTFYNNKEKGKERYIKIKEDELYNLCYKLIDLLKNNLE